VEHTWRWFGPSDPVTLADIRQTGATGIVTALHEVPNGEAWPVDAILERKEAIEAAGLTWSAVESVPVHEDIKRGGPHQDSAIGAYAHTLRNLGACGIDLVCYNFMPILDWTRTDLAYELPTGGLALRFDADALAAFDLHLLRRGDAQADYSDAALARARAYADRLDEDGRARLTGTILAGLPGSEESYTLDTFR
jgi:mannonate dehydratase